MSIKYYVIKEIISKSGELRDIHREVLGCRCMIAYLEVGSSCHIRYQPHDEPGELYGVITSRVCDYREAEDGSCLTIETRNTTYILEPESIIPADDRE